MLVLLHEREHAAQHRVVLVLESGAADGRLRQGRRSLRGELAPGPALRLRLFALVCAKLIRRLRKSINEFVTFALFHLEFGV